MGTTLQQNRNRNIKKEEAFRQQPQLDDEQEHARLGQPGWH